MDLSACAFSSSVATSNCCRIMAQKWYSSNLFIVVVEGGSYFGNDPERVESDNKLFWARFTYSFFLSSSLICGGLAKTKRRCGRDLESFHFKSAEFGSCIWIPYQWVSPPLFDSYFPAKFPSPFFCSKCHKKRRKLARSALNFCLLRGSNKCQLIWNFILQLQLAC